MRWRRIAPVIGWQRIFAGRWRRWLIINDSGANPGGPAARRRSAAPAGLLIAIVLPEKIPSLRNVRRQSKDEYIRMPPRASDIRPLLSATVLIVCTRRRGKSRQKRNILPQTCNSNRSRPWQESKFTKFVKRIYYSGRPHNSSDRQIL